MPAGYTETYDGYYQVMTGSPPGTLGLNTYNYVSSTLEDSEDSGNDGSTAVGNQLYWDSLDAGAGTTFEGFTADGDPIILSGGVYWVLSNKLGMDYGNVESTNSAPYEYCFAIGSLIGTESGEVAVEDIAIGDLILTESGQTVPVKWIGVQTIGSRFGTAARNQLVRFAAGSLGEGLSHSDLTVTADHAMLVEGVLCHAGALINGHSISRVPLSEMGKGVTVYHIETEAHEIIMANGAATETFIDNVSRRAFDNYAEFEGLYGDVPEMQELDYPRAMSVRQVPLSISSKLGRKAAA